MGTIKLPTLQTSKLGFKGLSSVEQVDGGNTGLRFPSPGHGAIMPAGVIISGVIEYSDAEDDRHHTWPSGRCRAGKRASQEGGLGCFSLVGVEVPPRDLPHDKGHPPEETSKLGLPII